MDKKFFVPFETAQLLKEKGYDVDCCSYYTQNGKLYHETFTLNNNWIRMGRFLAPTYHEVLDWLEENGIYITTLWNIGETDKEDTYEIWWKCFVDITLHEEQVTSVYHTREEALNAGILAALNML